MFLFQNITGADWLMWVAIIAALMLLNEAARANKWVGLALFVAVPIILTIFVWPNTAGAGSSTGTWFHWVKVYSALAGCLGFMALRFIPKLEHNKWMLLFPPIILSVNILEAVIRDFQVTGMHGMVDGVFMNGGAWNIMNGVAGIINIITITGWMGIIVSRDKQKDMIWPDQIWPWIIAYDLWNFAYVYNCVGDHSFYAGAALLLSCTFAAFFIKKGSWLQARAQTLAFWMMFTMSVPAFVTDSQFSVQSTHSSAALMTVSALALAANVGVLILHIYRVVKFRRNPLKDSVYAGTKAHDQVVADNIQKDKMPPDLNLKGGNNSTAKTV
ncbi:DUF5692 family protein [Companilactobacillus mishanensis]|uniref:Uncharacterized protein n=1 Tax=Companilactobacillus mishanensis TaxID=2486008 RepID=A0A5P0ZIE2_9LACO|nr:DUF5692 family protein [Companilactobacillus mishanensis]MQS45825.1 hypothetical protein [Companilactobacillus mishanensis]MQS52853.1 hypothetical protein [Companilactobacillus mishanensis]MQS89893.1 hypothetical protein [Companilactobacillus mishanensis]